VTVPPRAPRIFTVSARSSKKVALTLRAALMVTVQVPVPAQPAPDQPAKLEPEAGVAVSVTLVPSS
jgi:hypothetical protein